MAAKKSFFLTLTNGTLFKGAEDPDIELLTEKNKNDKSVEQYSNGSSRQSKPDRENPSACDPSLCIPQGWEIDPEGTDEENDSNQGTPSP